MSVLENLNLLLHSDPIDIAQSGSYIFFSLLIYFSERDSVLSSDFLCCYSLLNWQRKLITGDFGDTELYWGFPGGSVVKNLPAIQEPQEMWVWSLGQEDSLTEGMAINFRIFAWRIPWTEKPGGRQSTGLKTVGHNWRDLACLLAGYMDPHETSGPSLSFDFPHLAYLPTNMLPESRGNLDIGR